MKIILEAGDVYDLVDNMAPDNILRVINNGKLYVSLTQIERAVKAIVQKELQKRSLLDEEKCEL